MSEIFATEDGNHERNSANYNKTLILTAVSVIILAGLAAGVFMYFTTPEHGEKVEAPTGMEKAIERHLEEKIGGKISGIVYRYCEVIKVDDTATQFDGYVALVEMKERNIDFKNPDGAEVMKSMVNKQKVFVRKKAGEWAIRSFGGSGSFFTETHACEVKSSIFDRF